MTKLSEPIHPGKILYEQAMQPLGVSRNKLARDIDVPVGRISDIVAGKRGITPDTALRLGKYFGTSAEMWMQFQTDYDLLVARNSEWKNIAPRVRELQPIEPGAVAPVTAMDGHLDRTPESPDQSAAEQTPETEIARSEAPAPSVDATHEAPGDVTEEADEKWWSATLSDLAEDETNEEIAPEVEMAERSISVDDALDELDDVGVSADDVASRAEPPEPHRTIRLDVSPNSESGETAEASEVEASVSEHDVMAAEQTFEIEIHPSATDNRVVVGSDASTDEAAAPVNPPRRFTVDVVREATQALGTSTDAAREPHDPGSATLQSEPLNEDDLTIELDEDDLAADLPGDAFADDLDEEAIAEEGVEGHKHQVYAPVIARTGTDGFEPLDPPISAPGLDLTVNASAEFSPGTEAPSGIGDLTPANWSSALEAARQDGPSIEGPEASGPTSSDGVAAPEIDNRFAVPLPSEFEPAMEGSLPPWSPAETEDPLVSLDIPDPEKARKLYEYDD